MKVREVGGNIYLDKDNSNQRSGSDYCAQHETASFHDCLLDLRKKTRVRFKKQRDRGGNSENISAHIHMQQ